MPEHATRFNDASYDAKAFRASQGNRMETGKLTASHRGLRFESDTGAVELPWHGLQVQRGGHNDEQLFFCHPSQPDWSICVGDFCILEHAAFAEQPLLREQIKGFRRPGHAWSRFAILAAIIFVLIAGAIVTIFALKEPLVRAAANQVPLTWEKELGDSLFKQIQAEGKIRTDPAWAGQLTPITTRLLTAVTNGPYAFQFHILDDTNINAFAIPGGHVFVHTGLLQASERPEEIAGVLAHEIGHVTQKHAFRKLIDAAGLYLTVQLFLGDASGALAVIADGSQTLLRQKYSRDFEREADDAGWQYLIAANIDPRGLIDFFKKLKVQEEANPSAKLGSSLQLLNTHPATEERIQRLEAKWKDMDRTSGFVNLP